MGSLRILRASLSILAVGVLPALAGAASLPLRIVEPGAPASPSSGGARTSAACTLEPGPVENSVSYSWNTPDAFTQLAWRIPRGSCAACAPNVGLAVKTVSFRVRWFGPCSATAQVSVVGATGPPGCRVADPANVLCGPASTPIVGTGSTGTVHTLTVPAGCCVGPEAFVLVRFTGLDACYAAGTPSPGLTRTSAACLNCTEEVATTLSSPALTDWCSITTNGIWIQVEADCCGAVDVGGSGIPAITRVTVLETLSRQVRMNVSLAGPGRRPVELSIYDLAGRKVRELMRGDLDPGDHPVSWDGTSHTGGRLPAGVYQVRLVAGAERAVASVILLH